MRRLSSWLVEIRLNGEQHGIAEGMTLSDLLAQMGLAKRRVAIELNRAIVAKEDYRSTRLAPGDVVEVVQFVGGG